MKRSRLIAVIGVLLLSSCAHFREIPPLEERSRPQVTVRDGRIAVSPEILYYLPGERDVQIVWQLPRDSKYRFPTKPANAREQGIVIEGRLADRVLRGSDGADSVVLEKQDEIVRCEVRNDGLEFACLNRHTRPGVYKYTIRVVDPQSRTPLVRDPAFVNM
jgi:hypothetical protein